MDEYEIGLSTLSLPLKKLIVGWKIINCKYEWMREETSLELYERNVLISIICFQGYNKSNLFPLKHNNITFVQFR